MPIERLGDQGWAEVVDEGRLEGRHLVQVGRLEPEDFLPELVDLSCGSSPNCLVEQRVG